MIGRRRPLLRAAAVGGGAYLAGKHVANRQAEAQAAEDDQNARLAVLKQRSQVLNRSDAKPGKTVQSLNRHPGKTLGLSSSATK